MTGVLATVLLQSQSNETLDTLLGPMYWLLEQWAGELEAEFGSVCEQEVPENLPVGDSGRTSHCHRHRDEHEGTLDYIESHGYER